MNFNITESEAELLNEALHELLARKMEALAVANGYFPPGALRRFTSRDFGSPQIDALIARLAAAE